MSRALPRRPPVEVDRERAVVDAAASDAGAVFDVLSCATARALLRALYDEPATASDLAETVDSSLQNVRHHLDRLAGAGLVTEAGTWYSSKGREMTVYAPAAEPLVIVAADDAGRVAGPTDESSDRAAGETATGRTR